MLVRWLSMSAECTWLKFHFFVCFVFSGVGWETMLLKGDEAVSDATEISNADMTIKVRDPFFSLVLKVRL